MLTLEKAQQFVADWTEAWNSHDLEAIMSHYDDNVVLNSPTAAKLMNDPSGTISGKDALRDYFRIGLEVYPNLKFEILDVTRGLSSVVVYFANQNGVRVCELMELNPAGKVTKVVAHYGA